MKTDLSTYDNSWYNTGAPLTKRVLWYYCNLLFIRNPYLPISRLKVWVLRMFGARVGKGVVIKPFVNIKYPWRLRIGDYSWIGESVWIDCLDDVSIGAHCCLSQGAMLLCGNHNFKNPSFDLMIGKIVLEDGVWIGAQSMVGPNVICESHAVLAVNSVATGNLDAYWVYKGNPAEPYGERKMDTPKPKRGIGHETENERDV